VKRRQSLGLGFLCYVPYFLLHVLLQQVSVERYGLPYVPFLSWLAVSALSKPTLQWAGAASVALASSLLTLPALAEYHETKGPPYAALAAVEREARPPEDFVLSGHFMFHRYFSDRPAHIEFLPPAPRREIEALRTFWLGGGKKDVLYLAHPDRTDLETIAPSARRLVNRWEYGPAVRRFLSGARPIRAELVRIERPAWFSGRGFMISDEAGSIAEVTAERERKAYLLPMSAPSFLLLSGEPLSNDASTARVEYGATRLDDVSLGSPVLKGYSLKPSEPRAGYEELRITTRAGAPFLFKGLDYGPETAAGFVHGEGWYLPERDEELRPFRWTSPSARSLLHVPPGGAHLIVEGAAPLHYFEPGLTVELKTNAETRVRSRPGETSFKLEVDLEPGFADVRVEASRSFVPDRIQHNGDERALSLRVYRFELQPRERAR